MVQLFHTTSQNCSRIVTENYSTSFSSSIRMLHKDLRQPVFNIYGFVRFADEIVDTFHEHDKPGLLKQFKTETVDAIKRGISLNPILISFQLFYFSPGWHLAILSLHLSWSIFILITS